MGVAILTDFERLVYGESLSQMGQAKPLMYAVLSSGFEAPGVGDNVRICRVDFGQDELDDEDPTDYDVDTSNQGTRCPECGEYTACAYDAEGRALIHPTNEGDDE